LTFANRFTPRTLGDIPQYVTRARHENRTRIILTGRPFVPSTCRPGEKKVKRHRRDTDWTRKPDSASNRPRRIFYGARRRFTRVARFNRSPFPVLRSRLANGVFARRSLRHVLLPELLVRAKAHHGLRQTRVPKRLLRDGVHANTAAYGWLRPFSGGTFGKSEPIFVFRPSTVHDRSRWSIIRSCSRSIYICLYTYNVCTRVV